jgi:putative transcriptional regulator
MSDEMDPILLIASPQMSDPMFRQTVVLVWHRDEEGAIGVVINRSMEHRLLDVVEFEEEVDAERYGQTCISWGGPVEGATGTVVTTDDIAEEEGWRLACGLSITRSQDALSRCVANGSPFLLCLGYAGWGPGQLDQELADGGWLWTDCSPELLFSTPAAARYAMALATLGLSSDTVLMTPAEA